MTVPGPAVLDIPGAVDAALALRRELGVRTEDPLPCVLSLAEDHLGVDVVVAPLPEGWSGFYLPRPRRGLIAVNSTHAVVRQRFTIAHELGHHVLGHGAAPRVVAIAETPPAVEVAPGGDPGAAPGDAAVPGGSLGEGGASTGVVTGPDDDRPSRDASDPRAETASVPATDAHAPAPATDPGTAAEKPRDPKERAANAFAAELLCPAPAARAFVARYAPTAGDEQPRIDFDLVVRLSAAFGLSAWAVVMRLGTSKVLAHGPDRVALQARVDAAEHIPRYRELGLGALADELELIASTGLPRLPEGGNAAQLLAVIDPDRSPDGLPGPVRELRRMLGLDGGPV